MRHVSQTYWLNRIYTPEVRDAHVAGNFHLHDLAQLSVYCVGWDLHDLLVSGFRGVPGKTESRPARHFRAVLGQIVNFFYTLAGEVAGAEAFSNFDTLLAPFIRYDGLDYGEVKQAIQEFVFNLNVATRVGFQAPFTNLTFDLQVPAMLANQSVIIGGQPQPATYGDFAAEMELLNRAFFEVLAKGDARGECSPSPSPPTTSPATFSGIRPRWTACGT
jgi:ribonucleoside-triphosphate reductase (formate)